MGFLRRADAPDPDRAVRVTALVVEASAPPEGSARIGPGSHGSVRVFVDAGSQPRVVEVRVAMSAEQWLVPGMEAQVALHPSRPDHVEIDWTTVPAIEVRVAAGDPALADPIGARRKVAHALGMTQRDTGTARTDRFNRALEHASTLAAPAGRRRAVVLIATIRGRRRIVGDGQNSSTHDQVTYGKDSAAVLSVHVPGQAPYAVYRERFKLGADLLEPLWMPLPALVSYADRADVEILWDELAGRDQQLSDRVAGSHAVPSVAADQMAQLAVDNAKRALQYVQDPKLRRMLIDQYRAAGIDVGEE